MSERHVLQLGQVRISPVVGVREDEVYAWMGADPPQVTGGDSVWEETARPRRLATLSWKGRGLYRMVVTLFLDQYKEGAGKPGVGVDGFIERLKTMARPRYPGPAAKHGVGQKFLPPRQVNVEGKFPARFPGTVRTWVIESLEWGPAEYDGDVCVRQPVTVTLVEYSPASIAEKQAPKKTTYTVRKGDTLGKIAAEMLGARKRWPEIREKNINLKSVRGPSAKLPVKVGTVLRMPA